MPKHHSRMPNQEFGIENFNDMVYTSQALLNAFVSHGFSSKETSVFDLFTASSELARTLDDDSRATVAREMAKIILAVLAHGLFWHIRGPELMAIFEDELNKGWGRLQMSIDQRKKEAESI